MTGPHRIVLQSGSPLFIRLVAAAQGLGKGQTPPGTDPRHQRVRSVSIVLPQGVPFQKAAEDALMPEPGSAHATV